MKHQEDRMRIFLRHMLQENKVAEIVFLAENDKVSALYANVVNK